MNGMYSEQVNKWIFYLICWL